MYANRQNSRVLKEIGVGEHDGRMVTSDFRPGVEIRPFRACAMHPVIIIETVPSLWTWLCIPRSTEGISSSVYKILYVSYACLFRAINECIAFVHFYVKIFLTSLSQMILNRLEKLRFNIHTPM